MNKTAAILMFMGLLILGGIFYLVGFLSAYSTLESRQQHAHPLSPQEKPSFWAQASQAYLSEKSKKDVDFSTLFKDSQTPLGVAGAALAGKAAVTAQHIRKHPLYDEASSRYDRLSSIPKTLNELPSGIRPFAAQAYRQAMRPFSKDMQRPPALQPRLQKAPFGRFPPPVQTQERYPRGQGYYSPTRPAFSPYLPRTNWHQRSPAPRPVSPPSLGKPRTNLVPMG